MWIGGEGPNLDTGGLQISKAALFTYDVFKEANLSSGEKNGRCIGCMKKWSFMIKRTFGI